MSKKFTLKVRPVVRTIEFFHNSRLIGRIQEKKIKITRNLETL